MLTDASAYTSSFGSIIEKHGFLFPVLFLYRVFLPGESVVFLFDFMERTASRREIHKR